MTCIYGLHDECGRLIYIGKADCLDARMASHVRDARRRDTPIYRYIRQNGMPEARVIRSGVTNWDEAEREEIARARAAGIQLLNVAPGGVEVYCPPEQRKELGRKNAIRRETGKNARLNRLKRDLGAAYERGQVTWKTEKAMGELARRMPKTFPKMIYWGLVYGPLERGNGDGQ